jgi:hypothetical protein
MDSSIGTITLISLMIFASVIVMQNSFTAGLFILTLAILRGLIFLDQN